MQKDLAQLIQFEVKDPRMGMVTISHVKVAKDLGYADVYITVLPIGEQTQDDAVAVSLEVLRSAAGFLRHELAKKIKLRVMPQLRFHFDASIERGRHLHSLIEKAARELREKEKE
jgi:ribosome-binding factor A